MTSLLLYKITLEALSSVNFDESLPTQIRYICMHKAELADLTTPTKHGHSQLRHRLLTSVILCYFDCQIGSMTQYVKFIYTVYKCILFTMYSLNKGGVSSNRNSYCLSECVSKVCMSIQLFIFYLR